MASDRVVQDSQDSLGDLDDYQGESDRDEGVSATTSAPTKKRSFIQGLKKAVSSLGSSKSASKVQPAPIVAQSATSLSAGTSSRPATSGGQSKVTFGGLGAYTSAGLSGGRPASSAYSFSNRPLTATGAGPLGGPSGRPVSSAYSFSNRPQTTTGAGPLGGPSGRPAPSGFPFSTRPQTATSGRSQSPFISRPGTSYSAGRRTPTPGRMSPAFQPIYYSTANKGLIAHTPAPPPLDDLSEPEEDEEDEEKDEEMEDADGDGTQATSDSKSDSKSSSSSRIKTPDAAVDDEGDVAIVDPGQDQDQELIDHAKYWALSEKLDEDGWLPLVNAAYEDEAKTASTFMGGCSHRAWLFAADEVLATMNLDVLKAISTRDGNLARLYQLDASVAAVIDRYKGRGVKQPTVYVRCLTLGDSREPLTVDQALILSSNALYYAQQIPSNADNAYKIDKAAIGLAKVDKSKSDAGHRHFLRTATKDIDPSRKRRLMTFARVLAKIALECRSRNRTTMPVMQYVGYAKNVKVRSKQHDKMGDSSNWLCIFARAVLLAMGYDPKVDLFTVCLISEEWDGPVAEMLITRLARAYYLAGGFSIAQAGASMASIKMRDLTDEKRKAYWDENIEWVKNPAKTAYRANQLRERELRRTLQAATFERAISARKAKLGVYRKDTALMSKIAEQEPHDPAELQILREAFPEALDNFKEVKEYAANRRGV
ncbi:hypothetical protein BKA58DRAFT_442096 [Alternaria rosae]|uniref:uncharacterized protein n=1 Tax=Alternaria rosae TaxID=1187941 RepID=UPI001E8D79C6|nr:uncharacterized protein BKA58DRAFT_442096 [Alternaria rosae]KAH6867105.1 hypothetical protein BKA58DRAFT_442096 [Alternaria rosae]